MGRGSGREVEFLMGLKEVDLNELSIPDFNVGLGRIGLFGWAPIKKYWFVFRVKRNINYLKNIINLKYAIVYFLHTPYYIDRCQKHNLKVNLNAF